MAGELRSHPGIRFAAPHPRLQRTKMGSPLSTRSPGEAPSSADRTACWACSRPWVRTAALGLPVLPLVNVSSAAVSAAQRSGSPAGPKPRQSLQRRLPGRRRGPVANATGTRRKAGTAHRSRWAFGLATSARTGSSRQQRSMCARPAEGSMKTATRPSRKIASSATYRSIDMGTSTRTGSPGCRPAERSMAAAREDAASSSRKLVARNVPRRHSRKACASGRIRTCSVRMS